ncbi:AraC family transcriptional regulator [Belliella marina]|uniref:AraC family transcriptional regulator n=1 Tax=Belliella marina TaxID=1644146 RepID=A0ABW4VRG1_9BACT
MCFSVALHMIHVKSLSFVLFYISSFLCHPLFSQNLKFKTYQVEQGISNNSVNAMANDPSGGIWIGTWDGLNFFDGKKFKVYGHQLGNPNSLAGNYINDIKLDKLNRLWVWADSETISLKSEQEGFTNFHFQNRISSLNLDKNGEILILLTDGKKYSFREDGFVQCDNCQLPQPDQKKPIPKTISKEKLLCSYKDKTGNQWWGTLSEGLFYSPYSLNEEGTDKLQQYKSDSYNPYGLRSNEVTVILEDAFGNIWLGLKDGGISRVIKNSAQINHVFAHPVEHPELVNETVRAVSRQSDGTLWLGYYSSGVYYRKNGQKEFKVLDYPQELAGDNWKRIRAIFEDSKGTIWVGTYEGIFTIRDHKIDKVYHESNQPMFIKRNYGFAEDLANQQLWVACWGGAMLFDQSSERFIPFEGQDLLKDKHIRSVYFHSGKLYLATEKNGVLVWENGHVSTFDNQQGLLDNSTYAIYKDDDTGFVWIGTHGGITIWDEGTGETKYITQGNGLLSDLVYSLHSHDDKVWISTTKGLGFIKKSDLSVRVLLPEEGWQSAEYSEGASFKTGSGAMYFGGINGLNYFHPNDLDLSQISPRLDLQILENGSANIFEVAVKQIGIGDVAKDTIVYRVLPNDPRWKVLPESNLLSIDHLKDGDYLLEVKTSPSFDASAVSTSFSITSPWYTKKYIYILLCLVIAAGILFYRQYQSKKIQQKLEAKIAQRTEKIAQQKQILEEKNLSLDLKNKEIEEQRGRLLQLHNRQQNPDFEMDEFVAYLLRKIKSPLTELKVILDEATFRDPATKANALNTISPILEFTEDLENNTSIYQLEPTSPSLTLLPDLFLSLNREFEPTLGKYKIQYQYSQNLCTDWVSLDVVRLKLYLQYLFKGLVKFLDQGSLLKIKVSSYQDNLGLQVSTDSLSLKDSFSEFEQFNISLKSARTILSELHGNMSLEKKEEEIQMKIDIPFELLPENQQVLDNRHWKHLDLKEHVPEGKKIVLLFGKRHEADSLVKILDPNLFFLITEHEIEMMTSALHAVKIDLLVIYNEKLTENVALLLNSIKSKDSYAAIPLLYIYEFISQPFQEKLMDMGVNTFVKMPTSRAFINKTIKHLLKERRETERITIMDKIFNAEELAYSLSPNEKLMQEAFTRIKTNYTATDFKLETLCEEMGISKMKLYRIFKESTGKAPSDIIIQLRMDKASQLLEHSHMNISEVSYNCGFNDPKHFSKLFKKHFGMNPKSYQMAKNKILLSSL